MTFLVQGAPAPIQTTARPSVTCLDAYNDLFHATPHNNNASINTSTLAAGITAGATTATWSNAAGLSVGELIYVDRASDDFETRVIDSIDGNVIAVTEAFDRAHSSGVPCGQLWINATHIYTAGGEVLGRFLANAITSNPGSKIVVLGDSWTDNSSGDPEYTGFVSSITARYPSVTVVEAGVSGERLDQQLLRFGSDVGPEAPDLVVHLSGFANDITAGRTEAQLKLAVSSLIEHCWGIGADLLMCGIAPIYGYATSGTLAPIIRAYANAFDGRGVTV